MLTHATSARSVVEAVGKDVPCGSEHGVEIGYIVNGLSHEAVQDGQRAGAATAGFTLHRCVEMRLGREGCYADLRRRFVPIRVGVVDKTLPASERH